MSNANDNSSKKSQISAGFTICQKKGSIQKEKPLENLETSNLNVEKINEFVDDEISITYNKNLQERKNESKDSESIVPPLSLQNIKTKGAQNKTTGKLTRTTMHSTQIRDKRPLNNLKNHNTATSNRNPASNLPYNFRYFQCKIKRNPPR